MGLQLVDLQLVGLVGDSEEEQRAVLASVVASEMDFVAELVITT